MNAGWSLVLLTFVVHMCVYVMSMSRYVNINLFLGAGMVMFIEQILA